MNNNEEAAGRRPSKLSAALQNAVTATHIFLYRLSRGAIGGRMANSPVLLLTTTGHKSGRRRTVPLLYLKDQDDFVLVASNGGVARHPAWYRNLQANPDVEVEVLGVTKRVNARTAKPEEKLRLWPLLVAMYPGYARYQAITNRNIPLVLLSESQRRT